MSEAAPLIRGSVAWADLSPTQGREQAGRRPVVVVASRGYLSTITALAIVLPVTTVDRGLPNHVPLRGSPGLGRPSWAMTEHVRTIARDRISDVVGVLDAATLADIDTYLADFLDLCRGRHG